MKNLFLRQNFPQHTWPLWKKTVFWLWNFGFILAAGLGIGLLSLLLAPNVDRLAMFKDYLLTPHLVLLNLTPPLLFLLLLYVITNRAALSYGVTATVVLLLSVANRYKVQFRDDPLYFEDFSLIKEAGGMAGKYDLAMSPLLWVTLFCALSGFLFLLFFVRGRVGVRTRFLVGSIALCLCLPLKDGLFSSDIYAVPTGGNGNWLPTASYISKGFVYPFLHSVGEAFPTVPDHYSTARAEEILTSYGDWDIPEDQKVNIITLMLESYNDFSKFDSLKIADHVYEGFHQLESEGVSGNLVTNTIGGGTVTTERAFLSGLSDLPAFHTSTNAYPWFFQEQGYYTTGAHGFYSWMYGRANINQNLGFADYHFMDTYPVPEVGPGLEYNAGFFPTLIELWENRPKDQPYFSYNLTYQGHGPYTANPPKFGTGHILNEDLSPENKLLLENYLGSLADTTENLLIFFDYYRQCTEPVVIVMFGDHNPWPATGFYESVGINVDLSTTEGFYNYYSTRYLIWANDAAKETLGQDFQGTGPDLGAYFLMNEVFSQCDWAGPAVMQVAETLRQSVPVIHILDRFVEDGVMTTQLSPKNTPLYQDYQFAQYHWRQEFQY